MQTQKAFNPYWKGADLKRFDVFTDYVNARYQLTSPQESKRQETTKLSDELMKAKKRDVKATIDNDLMMAVLAQEIANRDDVIKYLKKMGYALTREGKNYISIKSSGKKAIRLKGQLYEEAFTSIEYLKDEVQTHTSDSLNDERAITQLQEKLDELIEQKALYNNERYSRVKQDLEFIEEFNDQEEKSHEQEPKAEDRQARGDFEALASTVSKLAHGARRIARKSRKVLSAIARAITLTKKSIGVEMNSTLGNKKTKTKIKGMKR